MTDVPLFEISWDEHEVSNAVRSIARGSYWAKGPFVEEFEQAIGAYLDVEHAVVVNSGTTALVAALEAHGIGDGDEVVVPAFSFIATANAIRLVGARPVFADIEPETYGLDPTSVAEQLSPDTAAILPVHCYGAPAAATTELRALADQHDLPLIEDAAEAFGATHDGQAVGTIGDSAALSFCQNKIVTTGEGGAVVTDDDDLAERVRRYRSHGRSSGEYFDSVDSGTYVSLGTNIRMADVNAAIGCAQMEKVSEIVEHRRAVAAAYRERIDEMDGVEAHRAATADEHVYQLFTVEFASDVNRDHIVDTFRGHDVSCKVYWDPPIHRTRTYEDVSDVHLPTTDDVASRVLSLPLFPSLDPQGVDRVLTALEAGLADA